MLKRTVFNKSTFAAAIALASSGAMAAQLTEIVVTAQKREQNLQDVPISLDVLQAADLSDRGISSVEGLAQSTPSLIFQKGHSQTSNNFIIRGIGSFAQEGGIQPAVSMTVDGVPLGRMTEFASELGDIERIEILRGPQGTLYGRNATGGVINVVRANATDEFAAYVEQTITDDEEYTTRAMVNGALTENVAGRLSGFYTDRDEYIKNVLGGPDAGGEENYGVLGKLSIEASDTVSIKINADYRSIETSEGMQSIARVEGQPGDTIAPTAIDPQSGLTMAQIGAIRKLAIGNGNTALADRVINDPFTTTTDFEISNDLENYGADISVDWELDDSLVLKSISAYRYILAEGHPDVDYTPATANNNPFKTGLVTMDRTNLGALNGVAIDGDHTTDAEFDYYSQELRLEGSGDNVEWLAGLYYNHNEESNRSEVPLSIFGGQLLQADPRDVGVEFDSYSAFGDVTFTVTEKMKLFGGLRWTREDLDSRVDITTYSIPPQLVGFVMPGAVVVGANSTYIDPALFDAIVPSFLPGGGVPFGDYVTSTGTRIIRENEFTASDRSEDWSGRLGGSYDVTDDMQVYMSASRGFVGSGANIARNATASNPILEPSISTAFELGMKSDLFDNSVRLNGAIFWQETEDLQTTSLVPGTVLTQSFNAGTVTVTGMESSITWSATDMLTLDASVSYLDSEMSDLLQPCYLGQTIAQGCNLDVNGNVTTVASSARQQDIDGQPIIQAPEWAYTLKGRLDIPTGDMPFDMYTAVAYTWQDDIQYSLTYDPLTEEDARGLLDATLALEDRAGAWKLTLFGKNITDEYFNSARSAGGAYASQGRLLTRTSREAQAYWGVKFRYNF